MIHSKISDYMNNILTTCLISLLISLPLASCSDEHSGYSVTEFAGDYRYHAGIAEFFDCKGKIKYYVANSGIHTDLQKKYLALGLSDEKDDVYLKVRGYLKEEKQMEGIHPATLFVPVKFISIDTDRGCARAIREGN